MVLQGLNVVEHATYIAAPGAGGVMADWGASVIKIEPPGGDPIRRFFETIGAESIGNPVFDLDNRGKRSIVVDTATPEGQDVVRRLVSQADVFLTNVRPAGLARAGLDYGSLSRDNPGLVYASVTGFGLTGPDANRPGFDIAAFWSRSGMAHLMTNKGEEPNQIRTAMGDHITSMATLAGVMAALFERSRTGRGRMVEASLLRAATYALGSDMAIQHVYGRVASNRPRPAAVNPIANFFCTRDGQWLTVVPRQSEAEWPKLCKALNAPSLAGDERFSSFKQRRKNGEALVAALDEAFAALDYGEIAASLDRQDIAWAPVQTAAQAASDPQMIAAGGVVETPLHGGGTIKAPGGPLRFPGMDDGPKGPAPRPGGDSRAVLADSGFTADEIDRLIASGVVQEPA